MQPVDKQARSPALWFFYESERARCGDPSKRKPKEDRFSPILQILFTFSLPAISEFGVKLTGKIDFINTAKGHCSTEIQVIGTVRQAGTSCHSLAQWFAYPEASHSPAVHRI